MSYDYVRIENKIATLHEKLPHMPNNGRQWLADNVWWIVLIAATVGGFGAVMLLLVTLVGGVFLAGAAFLFSAKFGGLALLIATIVITLTFANVVVAIMSVIPLKHKLKKGWRLFALSLLIGFAAALLTDFLGRNEWAILKEVIFLTIGLYALFEIRGYFNTAPVVS